MLAAPNRLGILGGYALSGLTRALMVDALLFALALLVGMEVSSSAAELVALIGLALVINLGIAMWAAGIALRFRSIQAGPLMQTPVFLILFLTPGLRPAGAARLLGRERRLRQPDHPDRRGRRAT